MLSRIFRTGRIGTWSVIPPEFNLGAALTHEQVEAGRGGKVAILWENAARASRSLSYSELDAVTSRLASSLGRLGVKRGDRVFLRLPNIPEFYVAALAVAKLGGVFVPSSTQFRASEVAYRLKDSGAVAAITTSGLVDVIDEAAASCPESESNHCCAVPETSDAWREAHRVRQACLSARGAGVRLGADWSDAIAFIASPGMTNDPKGVVHYHRYLDRLRGVGAVLARLSSDDGRVPVGARLAHRSRPRSCTPCRGPPSCFTTRWGVRAGDGSRCLRSIASRTSRPADKPIAC